MKQAKLLTTGVTIKSKGNAAQGSSASKVRVDFRVRIVKGKKHEAPSLRLEQGSKKINVPLKSNDQKDWYGWLKVREGTTFDIRCWSIVNKGGTLTLSCKEPNYPIWSRKTGPNNNGKCQILIPNYTVG